MHLRPTPSFFGLSFSTTTDGCRSTAPAATLLRMRCLPPSTSLHEQRSKVKIQECSRSSLRQSASATSRSPRTSAFLPRPPPVGHCAQDGRRTVLVDGHRKNGAERHAAIVPPIPASAQVPQGPASARRSAASRSHDNPGCPMTSPNAAHGSPKGGRADHFESSWVLSVPLLAIKQRQLSFCVTGEDKVARFDLIVAGEAGFHERLVAGLPSWK